MVQQHLHLKIPGTAEFSKGHGCLLEEARPTAAGQPLGACSMEPSHARRRGMTSCSLREVETRMVAGLQRTDLVVRGLELAQAQ